MSTQTRTALPTTLQTTAQVEQLVELLRSPDRTRPVALISTRNGQPTPVIDADQVAADAGSAGDVYVIPTGKLTFQLAEMMVEGTHVFGGAGRVYQPGTDWEHDLRKSPIRFAYTEDDATRAAERLVDDLTHVSSYRTQTPLTIADMATVTVRAASPKPHLIGVPKPGPVNVPARVPSALVEPEPAAVLPPSDDEPAEPAAPARGALLTTQLALASAKSRIATLEVELDAQRTADSGRAELVEIASLQRQLADTRDRASEQVREAKKKASKPITAADYQPEAFADTDDAVRHAVLLAWVARVPASEKAALPLPEYLIGDRFAESLGKLDAGQMTKTWKCIVDVLVDLGRQSRGIHPLRGSVSTDAAPITRSDGAVCYRAYVETAAPSARRLHFWKHLDGMFELSRVVTHEDMQP